jgi:dTDP-4-dehydrorhamnose 3,5-epimerase
MTSPEIDGVVVKPLRKFHDARGWLCELFRDDELPGTMSPAMAYLSETNPGVTRGPHEHRDQTDCFCFLGAYRIDLWDNRPASPTFRARATVHLAADQWTQVIIPPGVVHAYTNVGPAPALVVNCPDRLYQGPGRREPVDEIRHEDDPDGPFAV